MEFFKSFLVEISEKRAGFTLLELLLTFSLLALLLGLALPVLGHFGDQISLKSSASLLVQCLRLARVEALRQGESVSIFFGKNFFELYYPGDETIDFPLPRGVEISYVSFPGQRLFFFPSGVPASGGRVTLESKKTRLQLLITPVTARVRLE